MRFLLLAALAASATATRPFLHSSQLLEDVPAFPRGLYGQLKAAEENAARMVREEAEAGGEGQMVFKAPVKPTYEAHTFEQRVDHNGSPTSLSSAGTFKQRYWFDAQFYKPGGPVILLGGGETNGVGRLPFLEHGILRLLAEATGGIGVVHEHRYYGESFPYTNLTTDSYRHLTTLQSLQDEVHFARNIVFPGLENSTLTAPHTPWIRVGGSYAGAQSAFARKLYPDVWWGAIASSAVTTAIVDYWEYYEPIRLNGPPLCISRLINHTELIDSLLRVNSPLLTSTLKGFFGLPNVTLNEDFVNALALPLGSYQGQNWNDKVGSHGFQKFCSAIEEDTEPSSVLALPAPLEKALEDLAIRFPSWPKDPRSKFAAFTSYAAFIKEHIASACPVGVEQDACFGTDDVGGTGLEEAPWKSWSYQFCTEWGYFIASAPKGHPSLISRLIKPDYVGQVCRKAFPPGELNSVPREPNVTTINQYGSFDLSYPRLAFIDGSADPWLYATPHSLKAPNPDRKDTLSKPFKLIPGGVHHWDENGLLPPAVEPPAIAKVHAEEVEFVKQWMKEWNEKGRWKWKSLVTGEEREVGRWD